MSLKAIVIGTGYAGEGHALGLRNGGADVIALCGRTPEPAKKMAAKLGIDDLRFDWKLAINNLKPDIISIATTAAPHREMAEFAASHGCHVICDKPLALNAKDARVMLDAATDAGVKHGYCPTTQLYPAISFAKSLVEDGKIGSVRHVELMMHVVPREDKPYNWVHRLADWTSPDLMDSRYGLVCRFLRGHPGTTLPQKTQPQPSSDALFSDL